MRERIRGSVFESVARSAYYGVRGLSDAWEWYRESDERTKFVHIMEAVNYLRVAGLPTVFFEFGCHSGRTFSAALLAARFLKIQLDAYAFDSFEGLPESDEDSTGVFAKGRFRTDVRAFKDAVRARAGITVADDHIIKGFFDDSLTAELSDRLAPRVGFVHIDVDLYKSTVPVLDFVKPKLASGSVVLFDDWYCFPVGQAAGERRAVEEFLTRNPEIIFEEWKDYSGFGKSFFVVVKPTREAAA